MSYLYCQNTECGTYLGSLGGAHCQLCGWTAGSDAEDGPPACEEADLLPIGTRIRFTRTLTSGPDEFSPGNLYAVEGQGGEVTGHGTREGYWVKWDGWHAPFGAGRDEFEPLPNAEVTGNDRR